MISRPQTIPLKAAIVGNVAAQEMVRTYRGLHFGGAGLEAGGSIKLGTATTVDVTVKDGNGRVIYAATGIVADTVIDPIAGMVQGPLNVTIVNISNAAHTLTVYWGIKR